MAESNADTGSLPAPAQDDEQPGAFIRFPKLPLELRLMIWEYSFPDYRIVRIDYNQLFATAQPSQSLIEETRSMLLGVCKESRGAFLMKYQTFCEAPQPPLIWHYNGSPKSVNLRAHLKSLGLRQTGTLESMPKVLAAYMNDNTSEVAKFHRFGELKEDRYWRFDKRLWDPFRLEALQIRSIAFELDRLFQIHPSNGKKRSWDNRILIRPGSNNSPIRFDRLAEGALECITLLCKEDCEVITIQLDETGKLAPDQWTYKYDPKCQEHKERFGNKWSNVTWRVILGKKQGVKLWNRAAGWKVNNILWERQKRKLLLSHPDVGSEWHTTERFRLTFPHTFREPTLLPGGDGATYLGPIQR